MIKIPFSDVTPPDRRSIRNIPLPHPHKTRVGIDLREDQTNTSKLAQNEIPLQTKDIRQRKPITKIQETPDKVEELGEEQEENYSPYYNKGSNKNKWIIAIFILVLLGFSAFIMTVFSSARISIATKTQTISVDMDVNVGPEINADTARYEILKLEKTERVSVEAKGEEMVERKASGKIIVYNNYSMEPQRLITRTRFESKGLIYRIPESIIVPGKTAESPGQIEVEIFADEAGEKYNLDSGDFTVPGFKNDSERYKNFYAKVSTKIEGGIIGKIKKVEESTKKASYSSLETTLKEELSRELSSKIPEGFIELSNNISYKFTELPQEDSFSGTTLSKTGEAFVLIINKEDLSLLISKELLKTEPWQNIQKTEIDDFSNIAIQDLPSKIDGGGSMKLKIVGNVMVKAYINEQEVAENIAGMERNNIPELVNEFPGIESIKATVRPIWKKTFPKDPSKIYVTKEN